MGSLFPDTDEHPKHPSIPTSWPKIAGKQITVAVGITIAAVDLLPWANSQEDPPHREYHEVRETRAFSGVGSTSADTSWMGNSTDAANVVLGRYGDRLRRARINLSLNPTSTT